jgi:hypothetical protein
VGPTQWPVQWVLGFFLVIKWQGDDVDHLLASGSEIKNDWSCAFTSPVGLCGVDKDNFFCCNHIMVFSQKYRCIIETCHLFLQ